MTGPSDRTTDRERLTTATRWIAVAGLIGAGVLYLRPMLRGEPRADGRPRADPVENPTN